MWSINFSSLKSESPELDRSWDILRIWIESHRDTRVISPAAVAQYVKREMTLTYEDAIQLAYALEKLAEKGTLQRRFAIADSTGQLLHPYYQSIKLIPKKVQSGFGEWVDVEDLQIKPVFTGADSDG